MMSLISSQDWRGASTVVFSHELVLDFFLHRSGLVAPEEVRAHTRTHTHAFRNEPGKSICRRHPSVHRYRYSLSAPVRRDSDANGSVVMFARLPRPMT